jgi:hypothetical protein
VAIGTVGLPQASLEASLQVYPAAPVHPFASRSPVNEQWPARTDLHTLRPPFARAPWPYPVRANASGPRATAVALRRTVARAPARRRLGFPPSASCVAKPGRADAPPRHTLARGRPVRLALGSCGTAECSVPGNEGRHSRADDESVTRPVVGLHQQTGGRHRLVPSRMAVSAVGCSTRRAR